MATIVKRLMTAAAAACMVLSPGTVLSQTATIGEATETRNDVTGQLGSVARQIAVGTDVSADETVRTGTSSSAALRFLDNSSLNIGSVSTVVLDRFVYDPNQGTQDAVFNLTKGAMRFVSGGRRTRNATIGTPVGIIGIRGTDVAIVCDETPVCAALMEDGTVRICPLPFGTPVSQALREACLQGNNAVLPCTFYDITAQDEQNSDDEGNFIIIENNCVVSGPQNLDANVFQWLTEQLASGGPLPDPFQIASFTPLGPGPGLNGGAIAAILATVPFIIIAVESDSVSP